VDELCDPEHRPDAVQDLRLHAGPDTGPAGLPSDDDRRHHPRGAGGHDFHRRRKVHQLHRRRGVQSQSDDHRGNLLCPRRPFGPHPRFLDGHRRHPEFLQPAPDQRAEEGARGVDLHRLGSGHPAPDRRRHAVQQLPAQGEEVQAAPDGLHRAAQRQCRGRVRQERLCLRDGFGKQDEIRMVVAHKCFCVSLYIFFV